MASFRQEGRVCLLDSFLDRRRFHRTVIDKKKNRSLFDMVIGVACPARCLEAPFIITDIEFDELIGNGATMYLAYAVHGARVRWD